MTYSDVSTSNAARIKALQEKHTLLSERISREQNSLSISDFYLRQLKKQKLLLKEQIAGIVAYKSGREEIERSRSSQ